MVQQFGATLVQQFGYFNTFNYFYVDLASLKSTIYKGFAGGL